MQRNPVSLLIFFLSVFSVTLWLESLFYFPKELTTESQRTQRKTQKSNNQNTCNGILYHFLSLPLCVLCDSVVRKPFLLPKRINHRVTENTEKDTKKVKIRIHATECCITSY